jgi:hypothetical protein
MSIRNGFIEGVHRRIESDELFAKATSMAMIYLSRGKYPVHWVDFVVQKYRKEYDIYDAAAFLYFWRKLWTGQIAVTRIYIGCKPEGDKSVEYHNNALKNLPEPFTGFFTGGPGDGDGNIYVDEPINATVFSQDQLPLSWHFKNSTGPYLLEVGYTQGHTTVWHIGNESGFVRWPYGYNEATLSLRTENFIDTRAELPEI